MVHGSWVLKRSYSAAFVINVIFPPPGSVTVDSYSASGMYSKVKDGHELMTARYVVTEENTNWYLRYEDVQTAEGFVYQQPKFTQLSVEGDTLFLGGWFGGDMTFGHVFARVR